MPLLCVDLPASPGKDRKAPRQAPQKQALRRFSASRLFQ
jgi:hypothetical protein